MADTYGAPINYALYDEGDDHSAEAARRKGKFLLCSEFGGGTVTPEILKI